MEVNSDVELESENSLSASPRPARKNITLKLKSDKSPSSGRGRPRKSSKAGRKEGDQHSEDEIPEAPIFKTMEPGEPVHRSKKLRWDHKVNLLGEKVVDPLIHCCELCSLPILIYGRMIQCKHVFCFTCAKKTEKTCVRCGDPVQRIEQSALGTVFLCTYGGSKHGSNGCRRTYLSQRDLNAHIAHRHLKHEIKDQGSLLSTQKEGTSLPTAKVLPTPPVSSVAQSQQAIFDHLQSIVQQQQAVSAARATQERMYMHSQVSALPHNLPISTAHQPQMALVPQSQHSYASSVSMMQSMPSPSLPMSAQTSVSSSQDNYTSAIPVVGSRIKTLISVPIQDDDYSKKQQQQQQQQQQSYQSHMPAAGIPNMSYPPPSLGQYPVGSMAPNIHQPPPGVPMFSNQSVNLPASSFTSPPPGPVPQMMTSGPPRAPPPRMVGPPGAPRFFDNQPPRAPWTGPRGPAPTGPPHQRGVLRADYNYY